MVQRIQCLGQPDCHIETTWTTMGLSEMLVRYIVHSYQTVVFLGLAVDSTARCDDGWLTTELEISDTKELRRSKRSGWKAYCSELESLPEAARLMKILSCDKREKLESLKREDGTWTTSSEECLELLLETHFSGGGHVVEGTRAEPMPQADWLLAEELIGDEAVTWTVNEFEPYKAAGPDGVFPSFLQRGLDILLPCMAWRSAKVVFIPKAGKEDYTAAKSFRPISLISFLFKTMERIVDRYLVDGALSRYPIHTNQHAYRRGRSTETALHSVTHKVEKALQYKEVVLAIFFDIEGAFDKAKTETICNSLQDRGTSPIVVEWVSSALKERKYYSVMPLDVLVGIAMSMGPILSTWPIFGPSPLPYSDSDSK
ncbi:uncharacterized protein LOC111692027 [Anoplophora glabripennis]|uniref:uncharacterized protein LOC111692027 n=1 Tax=Anoplophora glabripennis TaxID=217634 RepID=UPI000C78E665|nr:uncharacterized protein LOC111692027 [Anoplophora glabripennis]